MMSVFSSWHAKIFICGGDGEDGPERGEVALPVCCTLLLLLLLRWVYVSACEVHSLQSAQCFQSSSLRSDPKESNRPFLCYCQSALRNLTCGALSCGCATWFGTNGETARGFFYCWLPACLGYSARNCSLFLYKIPQSLLHALPLENSWTRLKHKHVNSDLSHCQLTLQKWEARPLALHSLKE